MKKRLWNRMHKRLSMCMTGVLLALGKRFTGTLDGNGHKLKNYTIQSSELERRGTSAASAMRIMQPLKTFRSRT